MALTQQQIATRQRRAQRAQQAAQDAETRGVPVEDRLLGLLNDVAERNGLPKVEG